MLPFPGQFFSSLDIKDHLCSWSPFPGIQHKSCHIRMLRNNSDNRASNDNTASHLSFHRKSFSACESKRTFTHSFLHCPPSPPSPPLLKQQTFYLVWLTHGWKGKFFYVTDVSHGNPELCLQSLTEMNKKTNCQCVGCHSRGTYHAISFFSPNVWTAWKTKVIERQT